jgi:hypothetical protein
MGLFYHGHMIDETAIRNRYEALRAGLDERKRRARRKRRSSAATTARKRLRRLAAAITCRAGQLRGFNVVCGASEMRQVDANRFWKSVCSALSIITGFVAAYLWFCSASIDVPIDKLKSAWGTLAGLEQVTAALQKATMWNKWAAIMTCISVLFQALSHVLSIFHAEKPSDADRT